MRPFWKSAFKRRGCSGGELTGTAGRVCSWLALSAAAELFTLFHLTQALGQPCVIRVAGSQPLSNL